MSDLQELIASEFQRAAIAICRTLVGMTHECEAEIMVYSSFEHAFLERVAE